MFHSFSSVFRNGYTEFIVIINFVCCVWIVEYVVLNNSFFYSMIFTPVNTLVIVITE